MDNNSKNIHFFHLIPTLEGGGAEKVTITYHRGLLSRGFKSTILLLQNRIDYNISDVKDSIVVATKKRRITHIKQIDERIIASKIKKILHSSKETPILLVSLEEAYNVARYLKFNDKIFVIHNSLQEKLDKWKKITPSKAKRHLKNFRATLENQNIISVSQGALDDLKYGMQIKTKAEVVIHNPINIEEITKWSTAFFPEIEGEYIVHIARFHEQKRHDILFKAYELIKRPVKLVLLTSMSDNLQEMINNHPKKDSIVVTGFQKNPYPWIKNAKLSVLSSDREGFGMVLVESLACGTPIVSTNCKAGPSEILVGELSKYLAQVNDPEDLAIKIESALKNYPLITNEYTDRFSVNDSINRLVDFCMTIH